MGATFQIIVPVFNEESTLEIVLRHAKAAGYLKHMVFVDDASTDASSLILRNWAAAERVRAIRLDLNRKKEGAIRVAMEMLASDGTLAPYTILLDADSIIEPGTGGAVSEQLLTAIAYMQDRALGGIAFRIDAISEESISIFSQGAFADYSAMQFDQWLVGCQSRLWVINGPGGAFESGTLLDILSAIVPDFETGDLLITVELMKAERPIAFYPDIFVSTYVPTNLRAYFNQRRRWERGTTKVLWRERLFYLGLFRRPSFLAVFVLIHLSLYCGIAVSLFSLASGFISVHDFEYAMFVVAGAWLAAAFLKGLWLKMSRQSFPLFRYCLCAIANGFLWSLVTTPARVTGFCEAVLHMLRPASRGAVVAARLNETAVWLSRK